MRTLSARPTLLLAARPTLLLAARPTLLLAALALVGCPATSSPSTVSDTSGDELETEPQHETDADARDLDRPGLRRAGAVVAGDYRFELEGEDGLERRVARLESISGDEVQLRIDGRLVRTSRQNAWPMLCLTRPISFADGALRVQLEPGAAVYVIASDSEAVRIGPVPDGRGARIVARSAVSLEGCIDVCPVPTDRGVAEPADGDAACLFADQDPVDETEGLPIAPGAPVEVLEDDGEWSRVRIARPAGTLEGWLAAELVAAASEAPDWCGTSLRPGRCAFPGRPAGTVQSRVYIESTDGELAAPPAELFDPALLAAEPRIRACMDEMPEGQRPATRARIDIRLNVDADGQVSSTAVVRSEGASEALSRCVAERAHRIRFPAPRTGATIRRSYTFEPARAEGVQSDDDL